MANKGGLVPKKGEILIYQTESGQTKLEVRIEKETLWLSQADLQGFIKRLFPT
jgi:hypothetical protein